jgi:hypothetical protein
MSFFPSAMVAAVLNPASCGRVERETPGSTRRAKKVRRKNFGERVDPAVARSTRWQRTGTSPDTAQKET